MKDLGSIMEWNFYSPTKFKYSVAQSDREKSWKDFISIGWCVLYSFYPSKQKFGTAAPAALTILTASKKMSARSFRWKTKSLFCQYLLSNIQSEGNKSADSPTCKSTKCRINCTETQLWAILCRRAWTNWFRYKPQANFSLIISSFFPWWYCCNISEKCSNNKFVETETVFWVCHDRTPFDGQTLLGSIFLIK